MRAHEETVGELLGVGGEEGGAAGADVVRAAGHDALLDAGSHGLVLEEVEKRTQRPLAQPIQRARH